MSLFSLFMGELPVAGLLEHIATGTPRMADAAPAGART
jgi:hypothetical protein